MSSYTWICAVQKEICAVKTLIMFQHSMCWNVFGARKRETAYNDL